MGPSKLLMAQASSAAQAEPLSTTRPLFQSPAEAPSKRTLPAPTDRPLDHHLRSSSGPRQPPDQASRMGNGKCSWAPGPLRTSRAVGTSRWYLPGRQQVWRHSLEQSSSSPEPGAPLRQREDQPAALNAG